MNRLNVVLDIVVFIVMFWILRDIQWNKISQRNTSIRSSQQNDFKIISNVFKTSLITSCTLFKHAVPQHIPPLHKLMIPACAGANNVSFISLLDLLLLLFLLFYISCSAISRRYPAMACIMKIIPRWVETVELLCFKKLPSPSWEPFRQILWLVS